MRPRGSGPGSPSSSSAPRVLLAACVESAGQGDTPEVKARRDRFGRMAVEILTRAFDGGFRDPAFYRTSHQLDPIRGRDDFRALLRRLDPPAGSATN